MTKKRFLLLTMVASFVFFASFGFSSCNKNENDGVPTVEEWAKPEPKGPYVICRHCGGHINQGETHIHYFLPSETCVDGMGCAWYGKYHRHVVHFAGSTVTEDNEHLGGGSNK